MSAKHTPGPWNACCIHQTPHYVFAGEADTTICKIEFNDPRIEPFEPCSGTVTLDEARANARLIAAAPELLEALQDMVSDHESLSDATLKFARAAIAKATGEGQA